MQRCTQSSPSDFVKLFPNLLFMKTNVEKQFLFLWNLSPRKYQLPQPWNIQIIYDQDLKGCEILPNLSDMIQVYKRFHGIFDIVFHCHFEIWSLQMKMMSIQERCNYCVIDVFHVSINQFQYFKVLTRAYNFNILL